MNMIKILKSITIFLVVLLTLDSCVVEKRLHLKGYHVQWKNQPTSRNNQPNSEVASIDGNNFESTSTIKNSKTSFVTDTDSSIIWVASLELCDTIVLKNQDTIIANITKQDNFKVKYKRCERKSGEYFNISKSEIHKINYSDGRTEQFNDIKEKEESSKKQENIFKNNKIKPDKDAKIHRFALVSGISSIIGLLGVILSIVALPIGVLFPPFFIIGTVYGFLALKRINKEPKKWRGKDLAKFGFYVGIVFISIFFFLLLGILLLIKINGINFN